MTPPNSHYNLVGLATSRPFGFRARRWRRGAADLRAPDFLGPVEEGRVEERRSDFGTVRPGPAPGLFVPPRALVRRRRADKSGPARL